MLRSLRARVVFLVLTSPVLFAQEQPSPSIDELLSATRTSYSKGDYANARSSIEEAWTLAQQTPKDDPRRYDVLKWFSASLSAAGQLNRTSCLDPNEQCPEEYGHQKYGPSQGFERNEILLQVVDQQELDRIFSGFHAARLSR